MCVKCAEKDAYIKELEYALDGAVWLTRGAVAKIGKGLKISSQKAELLNLLYEGGDEFIPAFKLEQALPSYRRFSDDRNIQVVRQTVFYMRKREGDAFIETRPFGGWGSRGYRLGAEAREQIKALLA